VKPHPHLLLLGLRVERGTLFCERVLQTQYIRKGRKRVTVKLPDGARASLLIDWDNEPTRGSYRDGVFTILEGTWTT